MLEIKINKEIKDFHETFFMGLDLRQTAFALLGVVVAVAVNLLSINYGINKELSSWLSIICVMPIAFFGFFKYNGMPAEKFIVAIIKYVITPKHLLFKPTNLMMEIVADDVEKNLKEEIPYYD